MFLLCVAVFCTVFVVFVYVFVFVVCFFVLFLCVLILGLGFTVQPLFLAFVFGISVEYFVFTVHIWFFV